MSSKRFEKAIIGMTKANGGMNKEELRKTLVKKFSSSKEEIKSLKTRKDLVDWYKQKTNDGNTKNKKNKKKSYFIEDNPLTTKEKKYCRCLAHVSAQNDSKCYNKDEEWKKGKNSSKGCVNPYGICTKSVGRKGKRVECLKYYNLDNIPKAEVSGIAGIHGKTIRQLQQYIRSK